MPGTTPNQSWPYPLPGEVITRQHLEDLAEDMHFSLTSVDTSRIAAIQRTRGVIGSSSNSVFTTGVNGYFTFNIDHLDNWNGGGRAITAINGPTLPQGLYLFTLTAQITAFSAAQNTYTRLELVFERGGFDNTRRSLISTQTSLRMTSPVRVPAGAAQLVRPKLLVVSTVGGATATVGRSFAESSPRLSWVQIATG